MYTATYNDKQVNLIVYKNEPGILAKIQQANRLGNHLAQHGLPTRQTLDPRVLTLSSNHTTQYAALYNHLPGKTIAWESYSMNHLKCLGMALAKVHVVASSLPHANEPLVANLCMQQLDSMSRYFDDQGVKSALFAKLKLRLTTNVTTRIARVFEQKDVVQQLLHMDFVRGNILFNAPSASSELMIGSVRISGILDFEKVAYGSILHDLARTLAFLLVDCKYKTNQQIYKYFIRSGYIKHGKGQAPDLARLGQLTSYYLMYDFYKFLKHNPYQDLPNNEHFLRTKALLVAQGLVKTI